MIDGEEADASTGGKANVVILMTRGMKKLPSRFGQITNKITK